MSEINYVNKPIMNENVQLTKQKLAQKQPKQLETPLTVLGQTETQVEGALDAINNKEQVLTKAEYDALTPEEQTNGTTYYISDINGDYSFADTPIGAIIPYGGDVAPDDWLLCQGQAISRIDYSDLFEVIGTTYGSGDGSTTFNIPNLKGKIAVGLDSNDTDFDTLGENGGEKTHKLTLAEMPYHAHSFGYAGNIYAGNGPTGFWTGFDSPTSAYSKGTGYQGGSQAHNNLQPYTVTNYIIKAKITTLPLDFETELNAKIVDSVTDNDMRAVTSNAVAETLGDTDISTIGDGTVKNAISTINNSLSNIVNLIYPVGSIYISTNSTMPSYLTNSKTWTMLSGNYVLKTITSGNGGTTSNAGNTGSTTLTSAQSGVPAHAHSVNAVGIGSSGGHYHSVGTAQYPMLSNVSGSINVNSPNSSGTIGDIGSISVNGDGSHTHTVPAHNTNNNTAQNASQGHTHTTGMPQNIGVYVWKRTA